MTGVVASATTCLSPTTNPTLRALQRLRSPLSNDEWNKHLAVHDIRPHKSDAESLYIHALPRIAAIRNYAPVPQILCLIPVRYQRPS